MALVDWFEQVARDLRFGARSLARKRMFTAIAAGSLALGIGGSTAMYSVIYAVILDPFPYRDPDRLMSVTVRGDRGGNGSYYPIDQFIEIAQRNSVFEGVVASTLSDVTWTGAGEPRRLRGNHCTMNTVEIMGVPPLIGRGPAAADQAPGAEPVTVLGYKFWQRQFGGDPTVLGQKLTLNGTVRTVIGVMPPRFMWRGADVYLPDVPRRGQTLDGERAVHLLGRLKPGITAPMAEADLRPILEDLQRRKPEDFPPKWRLQLRTFAETFPSDIKDALWILFGAVGLLLLISCVNVSNLLLSNAAYRRREIALRAALGAGRFRLVRQLLLESLLLAFAGAAGGIVLAAAGLRGIVAMVPPNTIPDEAHIALNAPVLLFTLAVSVVAALFFGIAPALHLSGRDLLTPLKEAGRGTAGGVRQRVLRGLLVVAEVALSIMLLVGASLMIRTLLSIQRAGITARPDRILTLRVPVNDLRYADPARRMNFFQDLLQRIRAVPGVQAATINSGMPLLYGASAPVTIVGGTKPDTRPVAIQLTNEDYLNVMDIPVVRGRFLSDRDISGRMHTAVVNQAFVRRHLADTEPIGRVIRLPILRTPPLNLPDDSFQIAGVVRDSVNRVTAEEIWPEIYLPYTIVNRSDRILVLGNGRAESLDAAVKAQVYAADPIQPVMEDESLESVLSRYAYAGPRFNLLLFAVFAALGLLLALFGIYGVIAHAVAHQRREIGIRIALGASLRQVVGMVLAMGTKLLAVGILVGLAASLASVKVLSGLVRNVSTFDPYSFAAVAILVFVAGLFASFWPARRAARVDPLTALRDD